MEQEIVVYTCEAANRRLHRGILVDGVLKHFQESVGKHGIGMIRSLPGVRGKKHPFRQECFYVSVVHDWWVLLVALEGLYTVLRNHSILIFPADTRDPFLSRLVYNIYY